MSVSTIIDASNQEQELSKMLHNGNNLPPVGTFETTLIYTGKNQVRVATDILNFLYVLTSRDEDVFLHEDAARGALVAAVKFSIQSYYNNNKRQFTKEHKAKILKDVENIIDTQLDSVHLQQAFAH